MSSYCEANLRQNKYVQDVKLQDYYCYKGFIAEMSIMSGVVLITSNVQPLYPTDICY